MADFLEIIFKTKIAKVLTSLIPIKKFTSICDYIIKYQKNIEELYYIFKENEEIPKRLALILKNFNDNEQIIKYFFQDSLIIGNKVLMKIIASMAFELVPQFQQGDNFMNLLIPLKDI